MGGGARAHQRRNLGNFRTPSASSKNDGKGWHQGDVLKQPELARTLERIVANPDEFYTGKMAREIAEFMQQGGGLITVQDLKNYEVVDRTPMRGTYRDLEIISAPPPSSGGIALVETLNILEGFDLTKAGFGSADSDSLDRGELSPRVLRSRAVPGRSGVQRSAGHRAGRQEIRRRVARLHQPATCHRLDTPRAAAGVEGTHRLREEKPVKTATGVHRDDSLFSSLFFFFFFFFFVCTSFSYVLLSAGQYYRELYQDVQGKRDAGYSTTITDYWGRALSYQLVNASDGGQVYGSHVNHKKNELISLLPQRTHSRPPRKKRLVRPGRSTHAHHCSTGEADWTAPGHGQLYRIQFNPWEMGSFDPGAAAFAPLRFCWLQLHQWNH